MTATIWASSSRSDGERLRAAVVSNPQAGGTRTPSELFVLDRRAGSSGCCLNVRLFFICICAEVRVESLSAFSV
jgi:hypothetical protein